MNNTEHMVLPMPLVGDNDALPAGTALLNGQYVIERFLNSGGFGITYLARDSLDRRVVIKECYPESFCSRKLKTVRARSSSHVKEFQSLVTMFVREARSIAKLNHPNIVGVHQVFEDNDTAYMALDLIEGQDLHCVIEGSNDGLSPEIIVSLLRKLLDAIATVHAVDMLHRDISPDNILLDQWGNPVLIDFGAAREEASKKSRAISALLVVKDGYSPQEFYISGSQQGPCSDLYSLAATFFHLISGEAPPNSQNRLAALASRRPDPYPPLASRIEGFDQAFLQAIDQAMNVFPQDRIQSAEEWLAMIDTGQPGTAAIRTVQSEVELQKILSNLVSEVDQALESDRAQDQAINRKAEDAQPEVKKKEWEYLPPEDTEDATPSEAEAYATPVRRYQRPYEKIAKPRRKLRVRRRARQGGVLVLICAITFNIIQNPDTNIATVAAPKILQLFNLGYDLTIQISEALTKTL